MNETMMMSPADLKAVTGDNSGMNSWFWIIVLFLFRGGLFGQGEGDVQSQIRAGFDNNSVMNKLNGLESGLSDVAFSLNNSIKDSGYQSLAATTAGTNSVINAITSSAFATQQGQASLSREIADCC